MAFMATTAMWNLQVTESKRTRSGSNPTLSAIHTSSVTAKAPTYTNAIEVLSTLADPMAL